MITVNFLAGQNTFERTYQFYGNSNYGGQQVCQETSNEFVIISNHSFMYIGWGKFIKTNSIGDTLFTKPFNSIYLTDFCLTEDGGYMVLAENNNFEIALLRLDENFDIIWENPSEGFSLGGGSIIMTNEGNYVFTGLVNEQLKMINDNGDSLWARNYTTTDQHFNQVIQCDNGFALVSDGSMGTSGNSVIVKTDIDGYMEWMQTFEDVTFKSIHHTISGDIIIGGQDQNSKDPFVMRIDSQGNMIWSNTYSGLGTENVVTAICQTVEGDFILSVGVRDAYYMNAGYLVKMDENGAIIWSQPYGYTLNDVKITNDSCLIATGQNGGVYLVKTNQDGTVTSLPENTFPSNQNFHIYPNPSAGTIKLSYEFDQKENISLSIQNINGQQLKSISLENKKVENLELNCSDFRPGIYFITVKTASRILTEKLIIE